MSWQLQRKCRHILSLDHVNEVIVSFATKLHWYICYLYCVSLIGETGAGSVIASQTSCYHIPVSAKMNAIASLANLRQPITSDFKFDTTKKVVHYSRPAHYEQIGTFRAVVKCLEYAVDAWFIHRSSRRHLERCDNSCYRIKRRPRWDCKQVCPSSCNRPLSMMAS